ncbi:hypothetical protein B0H13DRAFT_1882369 [Mycena leptocephala]|nr:hypothetical protein B0H13DRAFT_1882369 [Mycena leptocephala]
MSNSTFFFNSWTVFFFGSPNIRCRRKEWSGGGPRCVKVVGWPSRAEKWGCRMNMNVPKCRKMFRNTVDCGGGAQAAVGSIPGVVRESRELGLNSSRRRYVARLVLKRRQASGKPLLETAHGNTSRPWRVPGAPSSFAAGSAQQAPATRLCNQIEVSHQMLGPCATLQRDSLALTHAVRPRLWGSEPPVPFDGTGS